MRLSVTQPPFRRGAAVGAILAALIAIGMAGAPPAHADPTDPNCAETERVDTADGWEWRCIAWHTDPDPGDGSDGEVDPEPPTEGYFSLHTRHDDEIDDLCWEIRWNHSPGYEPDEDRDWVVWQDVYDYAAETYLTGDDDHRDMCPGTEEPDPTGNVQALWTEAVLVPDLDFHVEPDMRALTGLPAFLEVDGDREIGMTHELPAPFDMSLSVTAEATFMVDWGDGTTTGPHATLGGPYPDGDIAHAYADTADGHQTVTVETTWVGSWSAGGFGGDLGAITTTDTFDLTIEELRSVRTTEQR